jgi:hypothetical protein
LDGKGTYGYSFVDRQCHQSRQDRQRDLIIEEKESDQSNLISLANKKTLFIFSFAVEQGRAIITIRL